MDRLNNKFSYFKDLTTTKKGDKCSLLPNYVPLHINCMYERFRVA